MRARADRASGLGPRASGLILAAALILGMPRAALADEPDRVRVVFENDLPAFVVALNGSASDRAAARAALLSTRNRDALGRGVFAAMEQVIAAAEAARAARDDRLEAATDELSARARKLDAALASAGLAYWIDSSVVGSGADRAVILFSFAIERTSLYRSGRKTLRALQLSRLDNLNWRYRAYGFTAVGDRTAAVVLLGSLEERLMAAILPALHADAAPLFGVEAELDGADWHRRARRAAIAAIRADLPAAVDRPLGPLAERLAQRAALFSAVTARLVRRGIQFSPVTTLAMPSDYRRELESELSAKEVSALGAIELDLAKPEVSAAFAAARQALAVPIEHHELQHSIDLAASLPMPAALAHYTGPIRDRRGKDRPFAVVARAELSAYLAELGRAPLPRLTLIQIADFVFDRDMWSSPECYATLVILDQLARDLGIPTEPLFTGDEIDRARAAAVFGELIARSPGELATAAKRTWKKLFRRRLAALEPQLDAQRGKQAAPNF